MWKSVKIASAFVGVIVGAGLASGQEILKYFTSFGYLGIIGVFVSTALFSYLGMNLTVIGSRLQTTSHKEAIYKICGKWLGFVVDAILVFTLFGVGVVMIAGAGSIVHQQFSIQPFIGSLILMAIMILDRKSTRLNSSHVAISYAVFCLTININFNVIER